MAKRMKFGYRVGQNRPGRYLIQRLTVEIIRMSYEYSSDNKTLFEINYRAYEDFDYKGWNSGSLNVRWGQDSFDDWRHASKVINALWERFGYAFRHSCHSVTGEVDQNGWPIHCTSYGYGEETYEQYKAGVCPTCGGEDVEWERERHDYAQLPHPRELIAALKTMKIFEVAYNSDEHRFIFTGNDWEDNQDFQSDFELERD